jgi:hypothetical protein
VPLPASRNTDAHAPCSPHTDAVDTANTEVNAAGAADGDNEAHGEGEGSAETEASLDDLEWDDVLDLWANAHACYIEKDRSILADSKRCAFTAVPLAWKQWAEPLQVPVSGVCTLRGSPLATTAMRALKGSNIHVR